VFVSGPGLPPGAIVKRRPVDGSEWKIDGRRIEGVTFDRIKDGREWLTFRDCEFVDCLFDRCTLNWILGNSALDPGAASRFVRCRFTACDLGLMRAREVRFEDCTFTSCKWEPLHLRATDLIRNRFVGVVRGLTLWGREAEPGARANHIYGNDFSEADLRGVGLRGEVPVDDQLWPAGDNYVRVDRMPDRMRALRTRLELDGDSLRLLDWLKFNEVDLRPELLQSVDIVRLDDPAMSEESLRARRALVDVDLG